MQRKRLPRIERIETKTVHDDEHQHLWAVSYADFLMALLSFFILFFSVDSPKQNEVLFQITEVFQKSGGGSGTEGGGVGGTGFSRLPASLKESLGAYNFGVEKENNAIVINFPDDIFAPGQYELTKANRELVKKFFDVIHPFRDKLSITVLGHTDLKPLKQTRGRFLKDNFALSGFRASSVIDMAIQSGFPEKSLMFQAGGPNVRVSRSLSIRIAAREESL